MGLVRRREDATLCGVLSALLLASLGCGSDDSGSPAAGGAAGSAGTGPAGTGGTSGGGGSATDSGPVAPTCQKLVGEWTLTKVECGNDVDATEAHATAGITGVTLSITALDPTADTVHGSRVTESTGCTQTEEGDLSPYSTGCRSGSGGFATSACSEDACMLTSAATPCAVGGSFTGGVIEVDFVGPDEIRWGYPSGGGDCARAGVGESPTVLTFVRQ